MRFTPPHAKKLASFSRSKIYQALFISTLSFGMTSVALADSGLNYSTSSTSAGTHWNTPRNPNDAYQAGVALTEGVASGANVHIDTGNGKTIYGGYVDDGIVNNNSVTMTGGQAAGIYAGSSHNADIIGNRVTILGGTIGGVRAGNTNSGNAENNHVTISGGSITGTVLGAYAGKNANNNTVTISGGTITSAVAGAQAVNNAENNSVTISGGSITGNVWGGYANTGNANNNTVTISGGSITGNVWGGNAANGGNAENNTVIYSGGTVKGNLYGGDPDDPSVYTTANNTLVTIGRREIDGGVSFFQNYHSVLDANQNTGLTVTGEFKMDSGTNTISGVDILGGGNLPKNGDTLTLVEAPAVSGGSIAGTTGTGKKGATMLFDYNDVKVVDSKKITATVVGNARINPQSKALSEGMLGSVAFINQGADLASGRGMDAALSATAGATGNAPKVAAFGVAQGGHSRYKTGSKVNVDGASLMLGVGFNLANDLGNFLVAPFVEGGWGNYSSHNSFNNAAAVSAGGDSYYFGVGSLFREDFTEGQYGHPYAEASLRVGRSVTKFSSRDLKDAVGTGAKYRSENIYYGAHLGGGYILNLQDKATLDTYAKYFYTRQDSDNVTLSTNDKVSFDAVDSNRLRLGTRYNHNIAVDGFDLKPYVGVAFEREFSGKAKASTYGHKIDAPTLRGNTGMLEVGLSFKPQSIQNMSIDFGVEGYTGRREGIIGSLKANYAF